MEIIQTQQKPLPQLIKQSATYKLYVPRKVEEKIRYLCRKYPSLEWSGVLFYTHTGTFEDNNFEIHCEDIYPMDLGSAAFTKFQNDETIVSYLAENIDLFQCDMGLIHSHNRMSCFFSGTDTSTLQSEGNDTNCFVSLIVNNEGTYCAAITRKVQSKKRVITEYLGSSYEFFGEGTRQLTGSDEGTEEEAETTSIEYYMLDIEREVVDNPYAFLDKRFEEIESQKKASLPSTPQVTTLYKNLEDRDEDFYDWIHSNRRKSAEAKEALLFDTNTMKELEQPYNWQPEPTIIHHLVCQMITCSLIIKDDIDLKQWITRHMEKKYKEIFSDELQEFDAWAEFITDFMVNHYQDDTATSDVYEDYDTYLSTVAQALTDELDKYPSNQYMETYKNFLLNHI
jgi:hypothetical protein